MEGNRQKSIKVIDRKPGAKRKNDLYGILGAFGVFPGKMHAGNGVFFPIVKENEIEEMMKDEILQKAKGEGFEIIAPIELGAMRTVIVKEVDSMIDEYSNEEVIYSIEALNEWAEVTEIYKFKTPSKMLKVQFKSGSMAQRAIKEGMVILNQRIPARRIEKEIFVKLTPCNNCYAYNHETKKCPKEKMTLCANCGEEGHKQSNCEARSPRCINCGEEHRTLAAQCMIRKDLIKEKRKIIRDRSKSRARSQARGIQETMEGITYAERAQPNKKQGEADLLRIPVTDDNKDIMTIIMSAVVYSHYMEAIVPGSFQSNMDAIYKANGLNPVKFPSQTPTGNIKELYNRLLRTRTDDEEVGVETGATAEGDTMDVEMATKRGRETSLSPAEVKEKKKKKEEEEKKKESHLSLPPQEKPPMPPPPQPPRDRKSRAEKETETIIEKKLREERILGARPRSSSQSSTASTGSSKQQVITAKDMAITIYVPNRESTRRIFATPLTKEDKEELLRTLLEEKAKITWEHPQVTRDMLIQAIQKKQLALEVFRFRMVPMQEYLSIKEEPKKQQKLHSSK